MKLLRPDLVTKGNTSLFELLLEGRQDRCGEEPHVIQQLADRGGYETQHHMLRTEAFVGAEVACFSLSSYIIHTVTHGPHLRNPPRRILVEPQVTTIFVVVVDVRAHAPDEMTLAEDHDVLKELSTAAADPALGRPVLPRTAVGAVYVAPKCKI